MYQYGKIFFNMDKYVYIKKVNTVITNKGLKNLSKLVVKSKILLKLNILDFFFLRELLIF